jgi:hypothetical protein
MAGDLAGAIRRADSLRLNLRRMSRLVPVPERLSLVHSTLAERSRAALLSESRLDAAPPGDAPVAAVVVELAA